MNGELQDYELIISFVPDSSYPSRVFRSMAGLIEAFGTFDQDFLSTIDLSVTSELLLHDIERGSLKAKLRRILEIPDKEALRSGDWKKVLGTLLDEARTFLVNKLSEMPKLETRAQLTDMQKGLTEIASTAPVALIHVPHEISLPRLLTTIQSFESSTQILIEGDGVTYKSERSERRVATNITVSDSLQEELLREIPTAHPTRARLPVKKPDLIGDSQWDLYMGDKIIRAKILDSEWLSKFHNRAVDLRSGDCLDAELEILLLQAPDGQLVGYRYNILKVFGVIPKAQADQMEFPPDENPS